MEILLLGQLLGHLKSFKVIFKMTLLVGLLLKLQCNLVHKKKKMLLVVNPI